MSLDDECTTQLKITVLGQYFVGKTSIVGRFVEGTFDDTYSATIGFTFLSKKVKYHDKDYILNIWDTSGSERHRAVAPNYYRGSDGCILVYDLTNPQSLQELEFWLTEFRNLSKTAEDAVPIILIGNKSDLDHSQDTVLEAEQFAANHNISKHLVASALEGTNVEEAFNTLVELCSKHQKQQFDSISLTMQAPPEKKCSC